MPLPGPVRLSFQGHTLQSGSGSSTKYPTTWQYLSLPVSLSRMLFDSRSVSSSTAALDCAHTRMRRAAALGSLEPPLDALLCPAGPLPGTAGALPGTEGASAGGRPSRADASATMVLVLPVPGGPCRAPAGRC